MNNIVRIFGTFLILSTLIQCKEEKKKVPEVITQKKTVTKEEKQEQKASIENILIELPEGTLIPEGMVWISGGTFNQGAVAQDKVAMNHERPAHKVAVDGFLMDVTEVTNAQYAKFVQETGYITVAEREIDWEEMKKQLPKGTSKPHDSILKPGSLTFKKSKTSVPNLYDFSQWWSWTTGANWRQPKGPGSTIKAKENHPVVHIAYEDAITYCQWVGRRLPTEAEWEYAARGTKENTVFFWGDNDKNLDKKANTWEGEFPKTNNKKDGYEATAPVKTYPANSLGLYDIAGNVWEWTSDWYNTEYYQKLADTKEIIINPKGATKAFNPTMPFAKEKVIKGGSFLCHESYCASYRLSSRMGTSLDSGAEHVGFRTVVSVPE